jgi:hypothetical protein
MEIVAADAAPAIVIEAHSRIARAAKRLGNFIMSHSK